MSRRPDRGVPTRSFITAALVGSVLATRPGDPVRHRTAATDEGPRAGLSGTVRIVAVADVFDALTSSRPYKQAWALEAGFAHLRDNAGVLYDPACVGAFLDIQDTVGAVAAAITR